jgi:hypothetical protein
MQGAFFRSNSDFDSGLLTLTHPGFLDQLSSKRVPCLHRPWEHSSGGSLSQLGVVLTGETATMLRLHWRPFQKSYELLLFTTHLNTDTLGSEVVLRGFLVLAAIG